MGASPPVSPWVAERAEERARLAAALSEAADGRGAVVVLDGPPGIGKTGLVDVGAELAGVEGCAVVRARAHELEVALPYSIVRTLLERVVVSAVDQTFTGAAAPAVRVLGTGASEPADAEASAQVLHGLYALVAGLARNGPLAVFVDDAHWSDPASRRFLLYLGHRARALGVVLVVALRGDGTPELRERLLAADGATLVRPAPLGADAVGSLLSARLDRTVSPELRDACRRATGGNPLLVVELVEAIAARSTGDDEADVRRVAELAPERVTRSVALRLASVPEPARRLARAAAILGDEARLADVAAMAGISSRDEAADAASRLAAAHLLADTVPLRWRHPLLQVAALAGIPSPERAVLHRSAASVLDHRGAAPGAVAAQLLRAEPAGEAWAVAALREAAADARRRGAPDIAARLLRRAREEDARPDDDLLLELARAELAAGEPRAMENMRQVMERAGRPTERARLAVELAEGLTQQLEHAEAAAVLRAGLEEAAADDDLWLRCLGLLAVCERYAPTPDSSGAEERLTQVADERRGLTPGERYAIAVAAINRPHGSARELREGARLVERAWPDGLLPRTALGGAAVNLRNAYALDEAEAWIGRIFEEIRPLGLSLPWMQASGILGGCRRMRGDLPGAEAELRRAHAACVEMDLGYEPTMAAELALVLVERGQLAETRELLGGADGLVTTVPEHMLHNVVLNARAALAEAEHRDDDAVALLLELGSRLDRWGLRRPLPPWRSIAARLLAARGEYARARALAGDELDLARGWGGSEVLGVALRGMALVGEPVQVEGLEASVASLERGVARLELARSLVELGAARRRAGRREHARPHLERGMELAHRCGAAPLAERARTELRAAGARPRGFVRTGVDALTPSERRVVELASVGRTNRQIAAELYVTVDTVETHLRHAFQKLDVRARDELSGALGANPTAAR